MLLKIETGDGGELKPRAVDVVAAGKLLGVHRNTVRRLIDRGELRAFKLGRRLLVPVDAIDDLLNGENAGEVSDA